MISLSLRCTKRMVLQGVYISGFLIRPGFRSVLNLVRSFGLDSTMATSFVIVIFFLPFIYTPSVLAWGSLLANDAPDRVLCLSSHACGSFVQVGRWGRERRFQQVHTSALIFFSYFAFPLRLRTGLWSFRMWGFISGEFFEDL
ncbi:uncharacterized protein BDW43DRAFT_292558 [Aspergillus alliaceus]|uniref:uncharacterized protein n=1 Tax=Petromyces alliaceus TaxID=209559 RepID=UPI0012A6A597|nr:uncharacterized protein BDW43DRAFT_292558 [Aspergillus alliaceus]KAB8228014.1 hypothetical protein BDW43DRAFT_292558 [Aspergillus alliaceus]